MSAIVSLRVYSNKCFKADISENSGADEKTFMEYQEENRRLRRLLRITPELEIQLCRIDTLLLSLAVSKEEFPPEQQNCEQEWSPSLGQEDPEIRRIKEEQEELETCDQEEQRQSLLDFKDDILTPACIRSECKQEFRQISQDLKDNKFHGIEKTVMEYRDENNRLRRLLRITPEIRLCRIDSIQHSLAISKEEVPPEQQNCEQGWSPSLGQEDPEIRRIKVEQEDLVISQEEEQLQDSVLSLAISKVEVLSEEHNSLPYATSAVLDIPL
ncbi:hypothetical protein UPYG_G00114290 [Umbra pygmaea]|uniref:Uncharacterized protein n=1 Tax=Umbra pygmaea TaxID=75934 RepID=A0ABD0XKX7_UMBPY